MFHAQTSRPFRCYLACVHQEDCRLSLASKFTSQDVLTSDCWLSLSSQSPLNVLASASLTFLHKSPHLSKRAHEWPLTFTLKSVTSQRACKCTIDFPSQVISPLRTCLQVHCGFHSQVKSPLRTCLLVHRNFHSQASHLAAVIVPFWTGLPLWHISFRGTVILLVWAWYCQLVPRVLCVERPLWAGFASDSICSDTVTCPFGQGRTLPFPILFVAQVPVQTTSSLQSRCHLLSKLCIISYHRVKVT